MVSVNASVLLNGVRVPRIIYGTAWKRERTASLVHQALSEGFRGIDTACQPKHYNEAGVGAGLGAALNSKLARSDIYLQTKFTPVNGQDPKRLPYDPRASLSEQVAQSFALSLQNLRTDYLDGLVLHSPLSNVREFEEVWHALEGIAESGFVKLLGLSNCYDLAQFEWLCEFARIKPAILQNRFYAATNYDRELRQFCHRNGVLYQSFWTLTANATLLNNASVQALAQYYGRTPAQVFFRYLTQIEVIPLTGTTSEEHMRDDLAIFDFQLTPEACTAISRLL